MWFPMCGAARAGRTSSRAVAKGLRPLLFAGRVVSFKATDPTAYGSRTFHEDPDKPGTYVVQKTFDRDPIIKRATAIRNEIDQRGEDLRLEMIIPVTMFYEWMQSGKLSPDDYRELPSGGIAIDPKKLQAIKREYSLLACS
jgi:hypothetical protein